MRKIRRKSESPLDPGDPGRGPSLSESEIGFEESGFFDPKDGRLYPKPAEKLYEVQDDGSVKNIRTGATLPQPDRDGETKASPTPAVKVDAKVENDDSNHHGWSPDDARKVCEINLEDVYGEMSRQASVYAYWHQCKSDEVLALDVLEAEIDRDVRSSTGEKTTETAIKKAVQADPRWREQKRKVGHLEAVVGGLYQRHSALEALCRIEDRQPRNETFGANFDPDEQVKRRQESVERRRTQED